MISPHFGAQKLATLCEIEATSTHRAPCGKRYSTACPSAICMNEGCSYTCEMGLTRMPATAKCADQA